MKKTTRWDPRDKQKRKNPSNNKPFANKTFNHEFKKPRNNFFEQKNKKPYFNSYNNLNIQKGKPWYIKKDANKFNQKNNVNLLDFKLNNNTLVAKQNNNHWRHKQNNNSWKHKQNNNDGQPKLNNNAWRHKLNNNASQIKQNNNHWKQNLKYNNKGYKQNNQNWRYKKKNNNLRYKQNKNAWRHKPNKKKFRYKHKFTSGYNRRKKTKIRKYNRLDEVIGKIFKLIKGTFLKTLTVYLKNQNKKLRKKKSKNITKLEKYLKKPTKRKKTKQRIKTEYCSKEFRRRYYRFIYLHKTNKKIKIPRHAILKDLQYNLKKASKRKKNKRKNVFNKVLNTFQNRKIVGKWVVPTNTYFKKVLKKFANNNKKYKKKNEKKTHKFKKRVQFLIMNTKNVENRNIQLLGYCMRKTKKKSLRFVIEPKQKKIIKKLEKHPICEKLKKVAKKYKPITKRKRKVYLRRDFKQEYNKRNYNILHVRVGKTKRFYYIRRYKKQNFWIHKNFGTYSYIKPGNHFRTFLTNERRYLRKRKHKYRSSLYRYYKKIYKKRNKLRKGKVYRKKTTSRIIKKLRIGTKKLLIFKKKKYSLPEYKTRNQWRKFGHSKMFKKKKTYILGKIRKAFRKKRILAREQKFKLLKKGRLYKRFGPKAKFILGTALKKHRFIGNVSNQKVTLLQKIIKNFRIMKARLKRKRYKKVWKKAKLKKYKRLTNKYRFLWFKRRKQKKLLIAKKKKKYVLFWTRNVSKTRKLKKAKKFKIIKRIKAKKKTSIIKKNKVTRKTKLIKKTKHSKKTNVNIVTKLSKTAPFNQKKKVKKTKIIAKTKTSKIVNKNNKRVSNGKLIAKKANIIKKRKKIRTTRKIRRARRIRRKYMLGFKRLRRLEQKRSFIVRKRLKLKQKLKRYKKRSLIKLNKTRRLISSKYLLTLRRGNKVKLNKFLLRWYKFVWFRRFYKTRVYYINSAQRLFLYKKKSHKKFAKKTKIINTILKKYFIKPQKKIRKKIHKKIRYNAILSSKKRKKPTYYTYKKLKLLKFRGKHRHKSRAIFKSFKPLFNCWNKEKRKKRSITAPKRMFSRFLRFIRARNKHNNLRGKRGNSKMLKRTKEFMNYVLTPLIITPFIMSCKFEMGEKIISYNQNHKLISYMIYTRKNFALYNFVNIMHSLRITLKSILSRMLVKVRTIINYAGNDKVNKLYYKPIERFGQKNFLVTWKKWTGGLLTNFKRISKRILFKMQNKNNSQDKRPILVHYPKRIPKFPGFMVNASNNHWVLNESKKVRIKSTQLIESSHLGYFGDIDLPLNTTYFSLRSLTTLFVETATYAKTLKKLRHKTNFKSKKISKSKF